MKELLIHLLKFLTEFDEQQANQIAVNLSNNSSNMQNRSIYIIISSLFHQILARYKKNAMKPTILKVRFAQESAYSLTTSILLFLLLISTVIFRSFWFIKKNICFCYYHLEGWEMGNVVRNEPLTAKETEKGSSQRMSYAVSSMCGWRQTMEDAHIASPDFAKGCSLFAVFDGHGGAEVSNFAKRFFEAELLKNTNFQSKKYEPALVETFRTLDQLLLSQEGQKEVHRIKQEFNEKENEETDDEPLSSGSTAVVCLVTETEVYCANAGDSRCMIYRNKAVEDMSHDHKPESEEELMRISRAGGSVCNGRIKGCLNLSRALGDFQFKANKTLRWDEQMVTAKPDVVRRPLDGTSYIVLGCDGIFEEKSNKEIMNLVKHKPSEDLAITAERILDALVAKSNEQETGLDNMSLIIVKMKEK